MPTYEEAQEEYCRVMGKDLGMAYHLLWNECALLHMRWDEYVEMFGKDQEQFDVMNAVAPGFFKSVQDTSWEHILLHLCRFADPAVVGHRRTLSLDALRKLTATRAVPNIDRLIEESRSKIRFAQDWRNRAIAHADMEHIIDRNAKPLAAASRAHVREALASIVSVLDAIDRHFTGASLYFGGTSVNWGGTALLRDLRLANRLRKERWERMKSGSSTPDDHDYKKWH